MLLVGRRVGVHVDLLVQIGVQMRNERALLLTIELLLAVAGNVAEKRSHRWRHLAIHRHWREHLLLVALVYGGGWRPVMRCVGFMAEVILVVW